jgi:hypothetical protein
MVGEASISMATACFGTSMNGNNGHDQTDVLYIAFPGSDAVPGANGANWGATSWQSFESSIEALGNKLIQRIGGGDSSSGGDGGGETGTKPPATPECSWEGHCEGATCKVDNDCSDPWACVSGKCALDPETGSGGSGSSEPNYECEWEGHCEGAACTGDGKCSGQLHCDADEKVCTMEGCAWAGHCLGAKCASDGDCSDPYECNESAGYCWYASE